MSIEAVWRDSQASKTTPIEALVQQNMKTNSTPALLRDRSRWS